MRAANDVSKLPVDSLSVGGAEAADRVQQIDPSFRDHVPAVKRLLGHRNGQAHLGSSDPTKAHDDLVTFLRSINALLRRDQDAFWRPHQDFVRTALDANAQEILLSVQRSISEARERYIDRTKHLSRDQSDAFHAQVKYQVDRLVDSDALVEICPACQSPSLLEGENSLEHDPDGDVWIEFTAHVLECYACGLELDGEEALVAAGIVASRVNDEIDYSTFMREHYADEI